MGDRMVGACALAVTLTVLAAPGCVRVPGPGDVPPPAAWPSEVWPTASPAEVGLDAAALASVVETIRAEALPFHSLTLVRHGRLVLDACFAPYDCLAPHDVASVTKSLVATVAGIAAAEGTLDLDRPALAWLPERAAEAAPGWERITVRDLIGMTSGLACGLEPGERELYRMVQSDDWVGFTLELPVIDPPGTRFAYCSSGYHLAAAILERATGTALEALARRMLFDPLGVGPVEWPTGPGGLAHGWGDLRMSRLDLARIGLLYLQGGRWRDEQVVPRAWTRAATSPRIEAAPDGTRYGLGWWLPAVDGVPGLFEARGRAGQSISVWPTKDLVLVVTAGGADLATVAPALLAALRADEPLPADPAGSARLARAVDAARLEPERREPPPAPPVERRVSGARFALPGNPAGVEAIGIDARRGDVLTLHLAREGRSHALPVGLDGRFRRTDDGPRGMTVACRGSWASDRVLEVEYVEPSGVNHLDISLDLSDPAAPVVTLRDPTGHLGMRLEGTPRDAAPASP